MKKISLHTDGSALGNPGKGGWGYILVYKNKEFPNSGHEKFATNNQMELTAAIKGLTALTEPCDVQLYSDSKYVLDGLSKWIKDWKKNNWRTSNRKEVKNKELWIKLDKLNQIHKIHFNWVKGHNGDIYNEKVDKLANDAAHKQ